MTSIQPSPPAAAVSSGLAYLAGQRSARPVWAVECRSQQGDGCLTLSRHFLGVGDGLVAAEQSGWQPGLGLSHLESRQPYLGEEAELRVTHLSGRRWRLEYRLDRDGQQRTRQEDSRLPPVSLSSLPLFAAERAAALLAGQTLWARFPVLKVMRSARISIRARPVSAGMEIVAAPSNPFLRLLFGQTCYQLSEDFRHLCGYRGLLEPRDRRQSGRWQEYLGHIALSSPLPLLR